MHVTGVRPRNSTSPDAGVQDVLSGAAPPVAIGGSNMTAREPFITSATVRSAGQVICSAVSVGPAGAREPAQAQNRNADATTTTIAGG